MRIKSAKTDALTDRDLEKIAGLLDERITPLATKMELKEGISGLESSLKGCMHEGFLSVMEGIDRLSEQMDDREKVGVQIDI